MKHLFGCSLCLLAVVLFATPLCSGQQAYTNAQQNFSINLPGQADESASTSDIFMMRSYDSNNTLAVGVLIFNRQVPNTREFLDSGLADLVNSLGGSNCKDTTYNGDFAAICDLTQTNERGVTIHGKIWVCIHNSYEYTVFAAAAAGSPYALQVESYLDSFAFLK